ncbi:membrane protein insertase YidC [Xylanimonas oleitrophica]|uniref:membrane protein insertase YidC n=1 Tax=Xylanimonas oleitrophica TaxID=2607479 RepID=UPI0015D0B12C|nr:membrane protein insertase YidC [Xylanimonas oleitrophica]
MHIAPLLFPAPSTAPIAADSFVSTVAAPLLPLRQAVAWVLVRCHDLATSTGLDPAGGPAWALAIVGLVVAVRLLLVPLVVRQVRAGHAMSALQPELQRIRRKYQGRTDRASLLAAREEQQQVMRSAGARPLAGCLPALLQAPVLFALYATLSGIPRHESVGALDAVLVRQADAAQIAGAPLSGTLLTVDGGAALAFCVVLVVVMAAAQRLTQRLALRNRPATTPDGPLAESMESAMRSMTWVLPVVLAVTAVHLPVGVVLYWAVSALWSAGQQVLVNRFLPHPGLRDRP